ncbi:MAG: tetratricopeptide repeat protein, partial [Saprospiraceae bacterium]
MCPSKNISWFFLINIVLLINIKQAICQTNKNVKVYYNQENIDNLILANKYDSAMRCLKNNIDNFKELKLSNKQLGQNFLTRGKLGVLTQIDSLTLSDLNNADSLLKNQVRASEDYIICLLNKALYFEKTFNISQAKYNYELFFNLLPTIYSKTSLQYAGYISYYAEFLKKNLEYNQSELLLWDALKIYKDSLDNKHEYIARILGTLGSVKALQNDRSSINLFLQALEILNSNKNIPIFYDEKARIINNLANVYSEIGSLEQADSCFNAVIDFFTQNVKIDETKFGISLFNYSNFLEQNGNYESSIEILMHALAIFQNIKAKEYIIPIKIKLANCYFETKNKENSIKHLNEVLGDSLLQKISVQSLPIRLNNIANIFSKLQNYLMADSIFTVALKLMEGSKNFNKLNKLRTISNLANCKFNLNQFKIADSLYTIACREKGKILIKNTDSYLESLFGYVQN